MYDVYIFQNKLISWSVYLKACHLFWRQNDFIFYLCQAWIPNTLTQVIKWILQTTFYEASTGNTLLHKRNFIYQAIPVVVTAQWHRLTRVCLKESIFKYVSITRARLLTAGDRWWQIWNLSCWIQTAGTRANSQFLICRDDRGRNKCKCILMCVCVVNVCIYTDALTPSTRTGQKHQHLNSNEHTSAQILASKSHTPRKRM